MESRSSRKTGDDEGPPSPVGADARTALVVSHPAHELLVHGWMTATRPRVHVLTDGSGRAGAPRLDYTTRVLAGAGATPGEIYGRLSDRAMYDAILRGDRGTFTDLAHELARSFLRDGIDYVVGDALEHSVLAHDVGHMLLGTAVELANRRRHRPILAFEFVLMSSREPCAQRRCRAAWRLALDADAFRRKRAATERYAPILSEVDEVVAREGLDSFRVECLHPSTAMLEPPRDRPLYETYGEALVANGVYERLIRYDEHVRPLALALWQEAGGPAQASPARDPAGDPGATPADPRGRAGP
jgi:hypothetical protein